MPRCPKYRSNSISIHALREEGDWEQGRPVDLLLISIHALREEGDCELVCDDVEYLLFLSTPSARRATANKRPCRAGLYISIHALREEGDEQLSKVCGLHRHFYPRPPRGGRQYYIRHLVDADIFLSTPSARRATPITSTTRAATANFYPRPPRGGRQVSASWDGVTSVFLSTPSARRATTVRAGFPMYAEISIHALREEGDCRRATPNT